MQGNLESAGFTDEERSAFSLLLGGGLRDVFREQHPQVHGGVSFSSTAMSMCHTGTIDP
eukprot:jgi/Pico_ML_1/54615/g507.t1